MRLIITKKQLESLKAKYRESFGKQQFLISVNFTDNEELFLIEKD